MIFYLRMSIFFCNFAAENYSIQQITHIMKTKLLTLLMCILLASPWFVTKQIAVQKVPHRH